MIIAFVIGLNLCAPSFLECEVEPLLFMLGFLATVASITHMYSCHANLGWVPTPIE